MNKELNILVVDDEEIMRSLFTDIFRDEGYKISTVCNGKEAEKKVKEDFFDVVFLDVHMPEMDDVETLRLLRKITPDTFVVMTDSMSCDILKEVETEGVFSYIAKPFNIKQIRLVVSEILEARRKNK